MSNQPYFRPGRRAHVRIRRLVRLAMPLLLLLGVPAVGLTAAPAYAADNAFSVRTVVAPQRCLAAHAAAWDPAFLWDCDSAADQRWYYHVLQTIPEGTGGYPFQIDSVNLINSQSGLCLTPAGEEGGQATVQVCSGDPLQIWTAYSNQAPRWVFVDAYGRCLATKGGLGYPAFSWQCYSLFSTDTLEWGFW